MKIKRTKTFTKTFEKCPKNIQNKVVERLELFLGNPTSPLLSIHQLKGAFAGIKTLNVTGDYRIWFMYEQDTGEVILLLLNVGTHSQLYG